MFNGDVNLLNIRQAELHSIMIKLKLYTIFFQLIYGGDNFNLLCYQVLKYSTESYLNIFK